MTFFAFFVPLIAACYAIGRNNAAYGIVLFFAGVFVWQIATDGPESLLGNIGCVDYGHAANEC